MRLTTDLARRLILLYAAILGLGHAFYALPGGPYYPDGSQPFWLVFDAFFVWLPYRGSSFAWAISVVMGVILLAAAVMVLGDPVTALLLVEAVALLAILFGRPVRDHVSRRGVPALRA